MNAVYDGVCDGEDGHKNAKSNFNRKGGIQYTRFFVRNLLRPVLKLS